MTAEQLRDLRAGILVELYRVRPMGRSVDGLQRLLRPQLGSQIEDIAGELAFLKGEHFVEDQPADRLAPGLAPFWFITSAGMKFAEETRLV